jgi:hypothetical protein
MRYVVELFQAVVVAALIGGPAFYYFLFMMKP